jgi:uncharacterized protein (TIGR02996 family)
MTTQTADAAFLLRQILAHPEDDLLRLMYADEIEAAGEGERAEFIRVQCELPTLNCESHGLKAHCEVCQRAKALRKRERILVTSLRPNLRAELPIPNGVPAWATCSVRHFAEFAADECVVAFGRGFATEVSVPLAAWLEHGPAVCREHPVERVTITDKRPYNRPVPHDDEWMWFAYYLNETGHTHYIPPELYGLMLDETANSTPVGMFYDADSTAEQDALSALSRTCILWAKSQPPPPAA